MPGLFASIAFLTLSLAALVQFLWQGTALFMRAAGHPSEVVGLVFLAGLPWLLRFLWSPLLDRMGNRHLGHFRSWILATQAIIFVVLAMLLATPPTTSPYALLAVLGVLSAVMGTQQTAIFGLAATHLRPEDRVKGMTIQALSYAAAGILMGAGILYWLGDLGWHVTVLAIVGFAAIGLLFTLFIPLDAGHRPGAPTARLLNQFQMLRDPRVLWLFAISATLGVGVAATFGLQSLMLIDAGFGVAEASLIAVVGANAVGFVGAALARPLIEALGGYASIGLIGFALSASCLGFAFALGSELEPAIVVAAILVNSTLMFALMPATRSILLAYCGAGRKATDFAAYTGLEGLVFMVLVSLFAQFTDTVGYAGLLFVAGLASMAGAAMAFMRRPFAQAGSVKAIGNDQ